MLCSDLDRTILPNGAPEESSGARDWLRVLADRPEMHLAYVSGRNRKLMIDAIETYAIPAPDYAIGDVGATIYHIEDGCRWRPWEQWKYEIAVDWNGYNRGEIASLLEDIEALELQEADKQNTFKLSYYAPMTDAPRGVMDALDVRLKSKGIRASLIWSIDEAEGRGLLDILPERANKYHAIRFLMKHKGFEEHATVFAGDSGNDLSVLTSGLQSVLVKNASVQVREEARRKIDAQGKSHRLYFARGGFLGMNGNYAAGVIEGLAHYIPEVRGWLSR